MRGLVLSGWAMRGFPTDGFSLHREAWDMAISWMAGVGGWEAWKETVLL